MRMRLALRRFVHGHFCKGTSRPVEGCAVDFGMAVGNRMLLLDFFKKIQSKRTVTLFTWLHDSNDALRQVVYLKQSFTNC
jgi:hypothetical protein